MLNELGENRIAEEQNVDIKPAGPNVIPNIPPEVAAADVKSIHEDLATGKLQSDIQNSLANEINSGDVFPPAHSTGKLAKGSGQALNQIETRRMTLLEIVRKKLFAGKKAA